MNIKLLECVKNAAVQRIEGNRVDVKIVEVMEGGNWKWEVWKVHLPKTCFTIKGAILVKHVSQRSPFLKLFQSVMCICEVWNGGLQSIPHNRPWLHRTSYLYAHPHWYKNRQQYKYKRQRWKKNYNNTNTRASLMDTYSWGKRRTACLTCCFFFPAASCKFFHILFPLVSSLVLQFDAWPPFKTSPAAQSRERRGGGWIDWLTAVGK